MLRPTKEYYIHLFKKEGDWGHHWDMIQYIDTPELWNLFCRNIGYRAFEKPLLFLNQNELGKRSEQEWKSFCEAFVKNEFMYEVHLDDNALGNLNEKSWNLFCDAIVNHPTLTKLALRKNGLSQLAKTKPKAFSEFCRIIADTRKITYLALNGNNIGEIDDKQWEEFCTALQNNRTIKQITLDDNAINKQDKLKGDRLKAFCQVLEINQTLREINWNNNELERMLDPLDEARWKMLTDALSSSRLIAFRHMLNPGFDRPFDLWADDVPRNFSKQQSDLYEICDQNKKKDPEKHLSAFAAMHSLQSIRLPQGAKASIRNVPQPVCDLIFSFVFSNVTLKHLVKFEIEDIRKSRQSGQGNP